MPRSVVRQRSSGRLWLAWQCNRREWARRSVSEPCAAAQFASRTSPISRRGNVVKLQILIVDSGNTQNRKFQFLRERRRTAYQSKQVCAVPFRVAEPLVDDQGVIGRNRRPRRRQAICGIVDAALGARAWPWVAAMGQLMNARPPSAPSSSHVIARVRQVAAGSATHESKIRLRSAFAGPPTPSKTVRRPSTATRESP